MIEFLDVRAVEAHAHAGSGSDRDYAALEMALEIEPQVEIARAHPDKEGYERPGRAPAIVDDQFVEPGMAFQDRLRLRLDRPCKMRGRPRATDPAQQRQRAHNVADRPEQNNKDTARRGVRFAR